MAKVCDSCSLEMIIGSFVAFTVALKGIEIYRDRGVKHGLSGIQRFWAPPVQSRSAMWNQHLETQMLMVTGMEILIDLAWEDAEGKSLLLWWNLGLRVLCSRRCHSHVFGRLPLCCDVFKMLRVQIDHIMCEGPLCSWWGLVLRSRVLFRGVQTGVILESSLCVICGGFIIYTLKSTCWKRI